MCFDHDARPPQLPADLVLPRLAGGAAAELTQATAADGATFSVALAESAEPREPAVLIVPDVRGLYRFYIELAERFAQAGRHAIVIDPFGRTAGTGERDGEWDFWPHVKATTPAQVQADLAAAAALLGERTGATEFVVAGFCFGGAQAFLAATNPQLDLAGAVGFYGALSGERLGIPAPMDEIAKARCPVLALFGGADEGIPAEHRERFTDNLTGAGVDHEVIVYPGAPHSFFDRKQEEFADASEDAWRRTLGFLDRIGAGAAA